MIVPLPLKLRPEERPRVPTLGDRKGVLMTKIEDLRPRGNGVGEEGSAGCAIPADALTGASSNLPSLTSESASALPGAS